MKKFAWRIFTHQGGDFDQQLLKRGGTVIRSEKYVYAVGETAKVDFITSKDTKTVSQKITATGDIDIEYKGTHALLLGISGVNGELAHYADAYANDQDWVLMYSLLVNDKMEKR